MEVYVRRKTPYSRLIAGAVISALGFYLLILGAELSGLALVIVGFVVSFPRSIGPVVVTVFALAYVGVWVAASFWVSSRRDEVNFDDWFSDNWLIIFGLAAFGVFQLGLRFAANQTAWKGLIEDYGQPPEDFPTSFSCNAIDGTLFVDDEFIDVTAAATDRVLILTREQAGSIFFPWDRVRQIRVRDESPHIADVEIVRSTPVPLRLGIPWAKELAADVPKNVPVVGA